MQGTQTINAFHPPQLSEYILNKYEIAVVSLGETTDQFQQLDDVRLYATSSIA
jgi:hypothetical protein